MNKKLKNFLSNSAKFLIAFLIIYYMIKTGKLNLGELLKLKDKKVMILGVIGIQLAIYILVMIRWYYLLVWQGLKVTFANIARITSIGFFFNSFMPGAIGGDLVKAFYIAKDNKENRARAIITIIIDRIIGFITLMTVALIALLINYKITFSSPSLQALSLGIGLFIFCVIIGSFAVFSETANELFKKNKIDKFAMKLPLVPKFKIVYDAFHVYSKQKVRLLKAMFITVLLDILNVTVFITIGRAMGEVVLSAASYFTAIPAGLTIMSIPIAPAGIGVGQGAFYNLFQMFGAPSGDIGVTIITIYQLCSISLNMLFVFVYLSNRKEVSQALKEINKNNGK